MLISYETGDGRLLVEVEPAPGYRPAGKASAVVQAAGVALEESVDQVVAGARTITDRLAQLAPDEIEVEFGLKFSAEAGVFVGKLAGEAQMVVRMKWAPQAVGTDPSSGAATPPPGAAG